ncbi:MAG TPA: thiamine pyrophosphate-binding protein [Baekduia sp.]|uniref:thiamine pyrophosphate-binding protein n=1 Tax=Baekduia sp. TaxID=2600305 RepID=UPI002D7A37F5|nr:thiamine pyrophosphate-binding protein [Baekduia sp.]HET6508100.1 thiamine pyrophosphate-binding protein [Baekduia sp.]
METAADVVGSTLARLGVDTAFGLMGSGNLVATNALVAGGATLHAARHEGGAVGMADGWARVTGRVGVASVHQGPGLTNTLTALAEAAKARTPLLVLSGETPAWALRSNFRIDQHGLVESVGAVAERLHAPSSAAADAARALRRAAVERRPVVLMLPIDLQAQGAGEAGAAAEPAPVPAPPAPTAAAIAEAAALLAGARRPAIVGGRGAVLAGAGEALRALGDRVGALLATSAVAHGLFAGDPYNLGISGGFASPLAAELLPEADVILAFGATLNHWTTRHGALIGDGARVIQVDLDPSALGAHRPADVAIVGDVAAAARALADAVPEAPGWRGTPDLAATIASRRWRDEPYEDVSGDAHVDPRTLSIALADLLPEDVAIAVDSGHFTGYPAMYLDVADPRAWLFANAFQAVGLGLGCAIGAAVARPDRVTVAALGDGGAFLSIAEIETAVRLGLRLLVVVYDDAAYGAEVHHFEPLGRDVSSARFPDADLAAIARGMGAEGITVRGVADLAPVATWLRAGAGPLVVDAKVDPTICAAWLEEAFRAG